MTAKPRETDPPSPDVTDVFGQIIPFRPRPAEQSPHPQPAGVDASPNEGTEAEEFKHRTLVNVAAFVFLAGLIGAGIWLAASISDLRRTQDCVLANRPNCAQIDVPPRR